MDTRIKINPIGVQIMRQLNSFEMNQISGGFTRLETTLGLGLGGAVTGGIVGGVVYGSGTSFTVAAAIAEVFGSSMAIAAGGVLGMGIGLAAGCSYSAVDYLRNG